MLLELAVDLSHNWPKSNAKSAKWQESQKQIASWAQCLGSSLLNSVDFGQLLGQIILGIPELAELQFLYDLPGSEGSTMEGTTPKSGSFVAGLDVDGFPPGSQPKSSRLASLDHLRSAISDGDPNQMKTDQT